jgi:hypothetical protein
MAGELEVWQTSRLGGEILPLPFLQPMCSPQLFLPGIQKQDRATRKRHRSVEYDETSDQLACSCSAVEVLVTLSKIARYSLRLSSRQ